MIRILAALSAGLSAATAVLLAAEGDLIPQAVLLGLLAVSTGLAAAIAILKEQPVAPTNGG